MLIEAPAASAEAATSIEVRFSGVVHPPCYGANADWSDEQDCELSRSEASFIEQPELSQPRQVPLTTAEENTEQWADGMEDNLARGQIHRQVNTGERYTRITLTPS